MGVSLFLLCAIGGESKKNESLDELAINSKYTHLIDTNQSQIFESGFRASLSLSLPYRSSYKIAKVHFIAENAGLNFNEKQPEFVDESPLICERLGYNLTSCTSGNLMLPCPYNGTYFKECCDTEYKYNKNDCSYPNTLSNDSCGGKYKCYCDKKIYPVTKCTHPQKVSDDSCDEEGVKYYSECICPSEYSQTCSGKNQEGNGIGCTYKGVTKYTSCKCKAGYTMTCEKWGPARPDDYCLQNGIKYYNTCNECIPKDCSTYPLTSAPPNANYTTCKPGCDNDLTYYKFTSCKAGYINVYQCGWLVPFIR